MERQWHTVVSGQRARARGLWLVALLAIAAPASGGELLLRWTASPAADAYHLYRGSQSRGYTQRFDLGALNADTINSVVFYHVIGLAQDRDQFFAVTASNPAGESTYSNERAVLADSGAAIPHADAGRDQSGTVGQRFTMGVPAVAGVVYAWFQRAGPAVLLSDRTQASVTFQPSAPGVYQFLLVAAGAGGVASSDAVAVSVAPGIPPTSPPVPTPTLGGGVPDDGDHDGVVDALDNCPHTANGPQLDVDQDAIGNACDYCRGGFTFSRVRLRMAHLDRPAGEQSFVFVGELAVPPELARLASDVTGVRLVVEDTGGAAAPVVLVDVGPGRAPNACGGNDGWESRREGARYAFSTQTDALTNPTGTACVGPGSANGLRRVTMVRTDTGIRVVARAKHGYYDARGPLRATIVLEAGEASPAALQGRCGTAAFSLVPDDSLSCRIRMRDGRVSRIRCSYTDAAR